MPCLVNSKVLNHVRDDPKLLDDGGEILKPQGRGWRFNSGYQISSILDIKLARWSIASCALALACRPFVSNKKQKKTKRSTINNH